MSVRVLCTLYVSYAAICEINDERRWIVPIVTKLNWFIVWKTGWTEWTDLKRRCRRPRSMTWTRRCSRSSSRREDLERAESIAAFQSSASPLCRPRRRSIRQTRNRFWRIVRFSCDRSVLSGSWPPRCRRILPRKPQRGSSPSSLHAPRHGEKVREDRKNSKTFILDMNKRNNGYVTRIARKGKLPVKVWQPSKHVNVETKWKLKNNICETCVCARIKKRNSK